MNKKPFLLTILDGFGCSDTQNLEHDAIAQANTANIDNLLQNYPNCPLTCSGNVVGLPKDQMGNSEVGHLHIGAGQTILQPLKMIDNLLTAETFKHNIHYKSILDSQNIHIMGLFSAGGVHAHEEHLYKILKLLNKGCSGKIYLHLFLDGRDGPMQSAITSLTKLNKYLNDNIILSTISGRSFAMDRDSNWDKIQQTYHALQGTQPKWQNAKDAIEHFYSQQIFDEFIPPCVVSAKYPGIKQQDSCIFFNFRADRARQLTTALTQDDFLHFQRPTQIAKDNFYTFTEYSKDLNTKVLFTRPEIHHHLSKIISQAGLQQLKIAETEKYAHVTYFFNGGNESDLLNETKILIPSNKVSSHADYPAMKALEITEYLIDNMHKYDFIVCNFANADMIGHTGNLTAAIQSINCLDQCIKKLYDHIENLGGTMLITADHGNAEHMYDLQSNMPHTAHTKSLVPCILTDNNYIPSAHANSLINIAPFILRYLNLPVPHSMSQEKLFQKIN